MERAVHRAGLERERSAAPRLGFLNDCVPVPVALCERQQNLELDWPKRRRCECRHAPTTCATHIGFTTAKRRERTPPFARYAASVSAVSTRSTNSLGCSPRNSTHCFLRPG